MIRRPAEGEYRVNMLALLVKHIMIAINQVGVVILRTVRKLCQRVGQ